MQKLLKNVDCVVEVHDARVPLSGRNHKFDEQVSARPRVLLLNKCDLIDQSHNKIISEYLQQENEEIKKVLFASCKYDFDKTIKKELLPSIINIVKSGERYNRNEAQEYNILIIGIPNVGKSSLINALRSSYMRKGGKATAVGAQAGVTKAVQEKIKVSEIPKIYVYDTPGIMAPAISDMDVAYKLAICDTIREKNLGIVNIADYLLFLLNKYQNFSYVPLYELDQGVDNIYHLLIHMCRKMNLVMNVKSAEGRYVKSPNIERASQIFLTDFRKGKFGKIIVDADLLQRKLKIQTNPTSNDELAANSI